ncbi:MAG TPA: multiheme c-type cytochrome [bacterium]|nr:multiheme c-type cytochrome [bacterium]
MNDMKSPRLAWMPALFLVLLLCSWTVSASQISKAITKAAKLTEDADPHAKIYSETAYPSAQQCATCHQQIYEEWSSSNHAYASISPMFHKFDQTINDLSQGTVGNFCMRCHSGVGSAMGEKREAPLWDRKPVSREGVTCISCHRVNEEYSKVNGERRIVPGDIHQPVYGPTTAEALKEVIANKGSHKVAAGPQERGAKIHAQAIQFKPISTSEFCMSCHQVAVRPGIKLEVVWDQYRASPAKKKGVSCIDCHMGKVPGVAGEFEKAPAAILNGQPVNPGRKHANHAFYGPGYPIAHPGIFPHHPNNENFALKDWLKFDYRGGWGNQDFEDKTESDSEKKVDFPSEWSDRNDREEARKIIDTNLKRLEEKRELRRQVMENGSKIEGPFIKGSPRAGKKLRFAYKLTNTNPGHNLPSGSLGAQPEIWLNVALIDPDGRNIWESGYVDANGDMADLHSLEVHAGKIAHDRQLFNLQTKFLTTNVKGTDREMYLPVNFDVDQLPFIRPANVPTTVMNHPPFIRMEAKSIPPLGSRKAKYTVPGKLISKPGKYKLAVRLRSRAEPIYFMRFCKGTTEMEEAMNQWMLDIHPYTVEFEVK